MEVLYLLIEAQDPKDDDIYDLSPLHYPMLHRFKPYTMPNWCQLSRLVEQKTIAKKKPSYIDEIAHLKLDASQFKPEKFNVKIVNNRLVTIDELSDTENDFDNEEDVTESSNGGETASLCSSPEIFKELVIDLEQSLIIALEEEDSDSPDDDASNAPSPILLPLSLITQPMPTSRIPQEITNSLPQPVSNSIFKPVPSPIARPILKPVSKQNPKPISKPKSPTMHKADKDAKNMAMK